MFSWRWNGYFSFYFRVIYTGILEIVAAYQNCVRQVELYGPTYVSPIINHVIRFAEQAAKENTASVCVLYFQNCWTQMRRREALH